MPIDGLASHSALGAIHVKEPKLLCTGPLHSQKQKVSLHLFKKTDNYIEGFYVLSDDFIHWPTLFMEVLSLDSWERFRTEGYTYLTIPNKAGENIETYVFKQ